MSTEKPRAYVVRDYSQFLATVDQIRADQGLSYRSLAALVGCAHHLVSRWLRGVVHMRGDKVFGLAHGLGYDVALIPRQPKEQP